MQDKTLKLIGWLLVQLASLECAMRVVLVKLDEGVHPKVDLDSLSEGMEVGINAFTDWPGLDGVRKEYNKRVSEEEAVGVEVVRIRDMVMHGRLISPTPDWQMTLYKFSKPSNDRKITVEAVQRFDDAWLDEQLRFIGTEIGKVYRVGKRLGVMDKA